MYVACFDMSDLSEFLFDFSLYRLLARRAQLFALKAELQAHNHTAQTSEVEVPFTLSFPSLLWIVEDFFQVLIVTCVLV